LPEEKSTSTQYKRVYSDWRPTIEKTDVVGAMEAIEGGYFVMLHPGLGLCPVAGFAVSIIEPSCSDATELVNQ
jgi:hypothetical protein